MTTDRPTATRTATLPQRPSAGPADRSQAAPTDAFSVLLGAASPRPADVSRPRRDDAPRPEPAKAKPADEPPTADEPQPIVAEEPTDGRPRPVLTPDLFALHMAQPLPTPTLVQPTVVPPTGAGVPVDAESGPAIPVFPQLTNLLSGGVPAAEAMPGGAAAAPATGAPAPGGVPLPFLAGLTPASQADAPTVELPAPPPAEAPADAAAPPLAAGAPADAGGEPTGSDTPRQPNPQAAATTAPQAAKPAEPPAPVTPTTQPTVAAAPVAAPAPAPAATALQHTVPLYRAPESAAQLIQIAAERGITHAKLSLRPAALGGIEVRLQTTPQGVTAQLVADSAEAAKLLTQAADDLRRSLADREVNLLSLDVTTQEDFRRQQEAAGGRQADIFGDQLGRNVRVGPHGDAGLTDVPAPADTTLVLPNGALVDVLA